MVGATQYPTLNHGKVETSRSKLIWHRPIDKITAILSMAADQFADLFSSATRKKDPSKLSLAERQKLSCNNVSNLQPNKQTQWGDFDILSASGSSKTSLSISKGVTPVQNASDLFEGFDVLNAKANNDANQSGGLFEGFGNSHSKPTLAPQNDDLLDSFALPSSPTRPQVPNNQESQPQDLDDLFAVFDKPALQPQSIENPVPVHTQNTTILNEEKYNPFAEAQRQRQRPKQTTPQADQNSRDEAIASLVDMGFPVEQAAKALDQTATGTNVQEAISFIMTGAHQKARSKAGLPSHESGRSRQTTQKSPEDYINNLTSVFSSVTKKVTSDIQNRFFSPPPSKDGKPAWLRDRERYKAQSQFDDDPDEIDVESFSNLKITQAWHGHNEKEETLSQHPSRHQKQEREPSRPSRPSVSRMNSNTSSHRPRSVPQPKPEEVDLFSQLPPKSQSQPQEVADLDLFSAVPPSKPTYRNDEMRTSSRRRPASTNPSRSSTSSPMNTRSNPPVSSTQMEFFRDSREQGGIAFKNGDFTTALTHYLTALDSLPAKHTLRIIAYSNCITTYLKVGENKKVIELANTAANLIGSNRGVNEDVEPGKPMKDFWIKITHKKAEALEHLEKFKEAQETWLELINNGAASKAALDGKRRCQEVLNPKPRSIPKSIPTKQTPQPASARKPQAAPLPHDSEALKRVQESNRASESFEEEKYKLYDQIEAKVNSWKAGKEDNLRALLSSLQTILWDSCNWKPVNISDLVVPKKVKITYMKAVAKVHPDKIPPTATAEQRMVAQSVFVVINQAWEGFKTQNGIQ